MISATTSQPLVNENMDNTNSAPLLELPTVPSDFEAKCGTTKTDLVKAIFQLLQGAKISGINSESPSPYDLAAITAQTESNSKAIATLEQRKIRRAILNGVSNGVVVVTFQDIGTENYEVELAYVTPNENFDPIQWSIIENTKTSQQVQLRLDGRSGAFHIEVTITSMDGI